MRHLISNKTHIDFMGAGRSRLALYVSGGLLAVLLLSLLFRGLNFGLDFTGGTIIEVGYPQPVEIPLVRDTLAQSGFGDAQLQHFGTSRDVLIRIAPREGLNTADVSSQILNVLKAGAAQGVEMRRVEFVGPQVGDELVEDGGLALLFAMIGILLYLWVRFEWRLSVGAIAATFHDVLITVGLFSLFQVEFDLTVLAAVLAVIGYSVNDTVVVFDRIRENFRRMRKETTLEIMNASINQTLSRTLMTSFTTLLAVVVLYLLGGPVLSGFSLALIIGIVVGTYSSIYVASNVALLLGLSREDLLPKAREEVDDRP